MYRTNVLLYKVTRKMSEMMCFFSASLQHVLGINRLKVDLVFAPFLIS